MLTSLAFLIGFLAIICAPGLIAQARNPARIRAMMTTPINHEIEAREPHNGYLILQGGLPEVDAFVEKHWK